MLPSPIWLIMVVVLVAGEALTAGLTFLWFAVGALGGLIVSLFGGPIWLQVVLFLALSARALARVRPVAAKLMQSGRVATNADRVIGKTAIVTEAIDNVAGKGQVSVAGQIWTARSERDVVIPKDAEVTVLRIEGVKVFVETK